MTHREAHLERLLYGWVRTLGGVAIKLAPTVNGLPDRLVILPPGEMYLIELKTNLGRVSPIQQVWHTRLAQIGVEVVVLPGVEEIQAWIKARAREMTPGRPRKPRQTEVCVGSPIL